MIEKSRKEERGLGSADVLACEDGRRLVACVGTWRDATQTRSRDGSATEILSLSSSNEERAGVRSRVPGSPRHKLMMDTHESQP
jgi:hypothetical protein